MLKRKIENILLEWKNKDDKKPLIVKGARQVGKTESIRLFAKQNYANYVEINFALQKKYHSIFDDGYEERVAEGEDKVVVWGQRVY